MKKNHWKSFGCICAISIMASLFLYGCGESVEEVQIPAGNPDEQLLTYSKIGDLRRVKYLIVKLKANPNKMCLASTGDTSLHLASANGYEDIVEYLIKKKASVNAINNLSQTPLHQAIMTKHRPIALKLIEAGADVNLLDGFGLMPVFIAFNSGDYELVKVMIKHNANLNINNSDGNNLLHLTTDHASEFVDIFISGNVPLNARNKSEETPLIRACRGQQYLVASKLLSVKADVNITNYDGYTPLMVILQSRRSGEKDIQMINSLIKAKTDINIVGKRDQATALCLAAGHVDYLPIMETLLKQKADISKGNPLRHAADGGNVQAIELLLKSGAKIGDTMDKYLAACMVPNLDVVTVFLKAGAALNKKELNGILARGLYENSTAEQWDVIVKAAKKSSLDLHAFAELYFPNEKFISAMLANGTDVNKSCGEYYLISMAAKSGRQSLVADLIKQKADLNVIDADKKTPLVYALEKDDAKMVDMLLAAGVDVKSYPYLHRAVESKNYAELIPLLLKHGAQIDALDQPPKLTVYHPAMGRYRNETPLFKAVNKGNTAAVKLLIEAGADVKIKDAEGRTMLHNAVANRKTDIVKLLIAAGADVNIKNHLKYTPLNLATSRTDADSKPNYELTEILLKAGADPAIAGGDGLLPIQSAAYDRKIVSLLKKHTPKTKEELERENINGIQTEYHKPEGSIKSVGNYVNGKREGEHRDYYVTGQLQRKVNYKKGAFHGEFIRYEIDGSILSKENYVNGVLHGEMINYDIDGSIKGKQNYVNGTIVR